MQGNTALHLAAAYGHADVVMELAFAPEDRRREHNDVSIVLLCMHAGTVNRVSSLHVFSSVSVHAAMFMSGLA